MSENLFIDIDDEPSMSDSADGKPDAVLIDCHHAGISGDMLLGALLHLGADQTRILEEIRRCVARMASVRMVVSRVKRASIECTKVEFEISKPRKRVDMQLCFRRSSDPWIRDTSQKVLDTLLAAESKVHGDEAMQHPHLHEIGQIDAVADIVGCLAAWRDLGLDKLDVFSTRVAVGGGMLSFSHGEFPVPAPATLEILKGVPVTIGGRRELTTPTGASLLVNLAHSFLDSVDLRPLKVGWGAGSDVEGFLNATRVVLGARGNGVQDFIDLIETSVDDATPEALGHAASRLMDEGALDVSIIPSLMKKGRPGNLLRVVSPPGSTDRICDVLMAETGSLGARLFRKVERRKLVRETKQVEVKLGGSLHRANVKIGRTEGGKIASIKPEYSDVVSICRQTGLDFPRVHRAILEAAGRELAAQDGSRP